MRSRIEARRPFSVLLSLKETALRKSWVVLTAGESQAKISSGIQTQLVSNRLNFLRLLDEQREH